MPTTALLLQVTSWIKCCDVRLVLPQFSFLSSNSLLSNFPLQFYAAGMYTKKRSHNSKLMFSWPFVFTFKPSWYININLHITANSVSNTRTQKIIIYTEEYRITLLVKRYGTLKGFFMGHFNVIIPKSLSFSLHINKWDVNRPSIKTPLVKIQMRHPLCLYTCKYN